MVWYPKAKKKCKDMCNRFDRIPACDGRTDRYLSCDGIVRVMYSIFIYFFFLSLSVVLSFFLSERTPLAVFTICRHSSWVVAFLQAVARPKFRGRRSASIITQSQVWLGLPAGRFQSGGAVLVGYPLQGLDGDPRELNCEQYGRRGADVY